MSPNGGLFVLLCCLVGAFVTPACSYKILMVCPVPARSHNNLCRAVVDVLVDRGHEVTFISAFTAKDPKFRDYPIPAILTHKEQQNQNGFQLLNTSIVEGLKSLTDLQKSTVKYMFENEGVKKLLADKSEKFDAVIFEHFFNEMLIGFGVKYDCPIIALSPVTPMSLLSIMTNNPLSLATVPNLMTTFTAKMTLWQRVINTVVSVGQEVLERFLMQPVQIALYEEYFPEESKRVSYHDLMKRISAMLVNSHPSIGVARPLLPHTIEIGGYHIKDPEPLPEDLKKILDSAKNGVIYFSMGSNLKSSDMSLELKSTLLKTLGTLKQTVLWKYEEVLPQTPKNVIIRKWMPQTGILAHPNTKLFISHGGILSCTEATHFGVPLLAIPIFGDQNFNAKSLENRGHGIVLNFNNITEASFKWTIEEALQNPNYLKVAKEVQRLFLDRPMRPRDMIVYHVEHVIRTKGAPHLSPPQLSRCSQLLIDVMAVIFIPLGTIFALFSCLIWKCCCRKKKEQGKETSVVEKPTKKKQKKQ
ncbi:UDP-glycosyltransferase UGT5-like [Arctopsyche grandis]|uniref:UDP-glycosyltransferase UGT5-like n=1 Tax=Arctopsyche grandis TaxID=121162 RepID=UPI00406DA3B9